MDRQSDTKLPKEFDCMTINGAVLVGAAERQREPKFRGYNPATGEAIGPDISESSASDVGDACALAEAAVATFAGLDPERRAAFIDAVVQAILDIGDVLVETAMAESGLPRGRLDGERMRTVNQLRLFSAEVREGRWLDVAIDPALPDRSPPRGDLRRMNVAVGPVAVVGASNFPLAFSVAGGDTASAFAAGCPVVVKGHPAHPATGELVARAVRRAVVEQGLPEGVFSYLPGRSNELGAALGADPRIKAVGFTGSRAGGLALVDIAAKRREPIPVYAEMSSINPVVLMPAALAARAEALGEAFVGSLTLGAGQFCTNPGLVIAIDGPDLERFVAAASAALGEVEPPAMLTSGIHAAYGQGVAALDGQAKRIAAGKTASAPNRCSGAIFGASGAEFAANPALGAEVFGASSLIIRCRDLAEMASVIAGLEGQLTATLHLDAADEADAGAILPLLQEKAGRVLANGWPTGVEVTHAMVHGGPFPATSDGRTTSVGTLAMMRFLRPVCLQDIPDALLPPALQAANPWQLPRRVDGKWQ
jgi:NADP-dependent aldehyde dehydrogenase